MVYPETLTLRYGTDKDYYQKQLGGINYAIVKHPPWTNFDPETNPGLTNLLPSAQKISDSPDQPYKGDTIPIYDNWWKYIEKINTGYPKGYEYARSIGSLWININYLPDKTPRSECVMSGGNFVRFVEETNTHIKILTYSHLMDTSNLTADWFKDPDMVWKCTAYNEAGYSFKVWGGVDSFIPQIKKTEAWINKNNVEIFPRGHNYTLYGCDVWQDGVPVLVVDRYGNRIVNTMGLTTPGVNPPVGWKA